MTVLFTTNKEKVIEILKERKSEGVRERERKREIERERESEREVPREGGPE